MCCTQYSIPDLGSLQPAGVHPDWTLRRFHEQSLPAMARVQLQNVSKSFATQKRSEVHAVHDLNLSVEDQEFLVLVGPSGCGKSTTLRLIAGLEPLTSGSIYIGDQCVNKLEPKDRDVAMVFQNYALYPHMTVYENMAFGLRLRKFSKSEIEKRVHEASAILGLGDFLQRLPKTLSGGQRQRVAVGRAIVRKPQAFLFDEPLSNLDAQMRVQMRMELARLHRRLQATMIYVTHDQVEAMTLGDRIAVLKDGWLQQVADPQTLYRKPRNRFVAEFIGSPPMNFLQGKLGRSQPHILFVEERDSSQPDLEPLRVQLPPNLDSQLRSASNSKDTVVLGIRPEHVRVKEKEMKATAMADMDEAQAVVDIVEPMGSETHWHVRTAGHSLVIRLPDHQPFTPGGRVTLRFDRNAWQLFDHQTGEALPSE